MIDIPVIDELREARRRVAEQAGGNARRYADLLRETAARSSAPRVDRPLHAQEKPPGAKPTAA